MPSEFPDDPPQTGGGGGGGAAPGVPAPGIQSPLSQVSSMGMPASPLFGQRNRRVFAAIPHSMSLDSFHQGGFGEILSQLMQSGAMRGGMF